MRRMLACALVVLLAGCTSGADDTDGTVATPERGSDSVSSGGAGSTNVPGGNTLAATGEQLVMMSDPRILRVLRLVNDAEIAAGNLALSKATDVTVRQYAEKMVDEHMAANERLSALLRSEGVLPEESPLSINVTEDALLGSAVLSSLTGAPFDVAYVDLQVAMHGKTLFLLESLFARTAQNGQLIAELDQMRAAVQAHLNDAMPLQAALRQLR